MKLKALNLAILGAVTLGAASVSSTAAAEVKVAGSAAVANMYLWRGVDLSNGSPAVSGDIVVSAGGAYAGVWGSSGDDSNGQEYDLFVGYGKEFGDFSFDVSVWNYLYPSSPETEVLVDDDGNVVLDDEGEEVYVSADNSLDDFGGLSEVIVTLGYGPVSFSYYDNIAGDSGYEYYTLGGGFGAFSATLGYHDFEDPSGQDWDSDFAHLDLGYAYNDNLSFTLSQVIDSDEEAGVDEDLKFVVSYGLNFDL
tara:strand:+ start:3922 stop:4674 length:753 start_codon:yes stop_codon:yes gene_type:complete